MVEVLMAGTILAMATFMVVGLLKLSDEMSYRAKVDAKVAQIMKSRAVMLVNMSFERLRSFTSVSGLSVGAQNTYEFTRGQFGVGDVSNAQFRFSDNGNGFPFLDTYDPVTIDQTGGGRLYLLSGKPLPTQTTPRDIFPFVERVSLQFVSYDNIPLPPGDSAVCRVNVVYEIWWINEFIRSTVIVDPLSDTSGKVSSIAFEFAKYDPARY